MFLVSLGEHLVLDARTIVAIDIDRSGSGSTIWTSDGGEHWTELEPGDVHARVNQHLQALEAVAG